MARIASRGKSQTPLINDVQVTTDTLTEGGDFSLFAPLPVCMPLTE